MKILQTMLLGLLLIAIAIAIAAKQSKTRRESGYRWAMKLLAESNDISGTEKYIKNKTDNPFDFDDFERGALAALRDFRENKHKTGA